MKASGLFVGLGTGPVRIGLGFQPDRIRIVQIGTANLVTLDWTRDMARSATGAGGIVRVGVGNTPGLVLLTNKAGVRQYNGGCSVDVSSLAHQIVYNTVPGWQGTLQGIITEFVLDTPDNGTGHFDQAVNAAQCGVGSLIAVGRVQGPLDVGKYNAAIIAMAGNGTAANSVTLDRTIPSGPVRYIGPSLDYIPAPVGVCMPPGFEILDTTYANVAQTVCAFQAESDD